MRDKMQIVISIPEDVYTRLLDNGRPMDIADGIVIDRAIRNGTPLPQGHGRIADMDAAIKCIEDIEGDDAIWAISLIEWACGKRTIIEADKETESVKEPCDDYDVSYCEQRDCVECEYNLHI